MKRPPTALIRPWAITPDWMRVVVSVWSRGEVFAEDRMRALQARDGEKLENTRNTTKRDGVAIVPIYGLLFRHADLFMAISGGTSYATLRKDIQRAVDDSSVKAIVLDVDSPGGEVDGCAELAKYIGECPKPIVAYAGGMAASAAYWLSSACRRIVCAPTAMLGSIGVRTALIDDSERDAKEGVKSVEIISSQSPGKRDRPIDDEIIAKAQAHADYLADIFIETVAQNRGVDAKTVVSDFGGGDVVIGQRAVDAGMADAVGDLESLISELSQADSLSPAAQARAKQGAFMKKSERAIKAEGGTPEPMPEGTAEAEDKDEAGDMETCGHCKGSGENPDGSKCETCGGSGEVPVHKGDAEANASDGDGDEDDKEPNEAEAEGEADAEYEDGEADAEEDDEKKSEARAQRRFAKKLGLPATASLREILTAANATAVPLTRMETIVAERVKAQFDAEKKAAAKKEAQARAEKLAADAIRGGYDAQDKKALIQFAMINYDAAERSVAQYLQKARELFGAVTHAGSPGGAERSSLKSDIQIKNAGATKVVKHGVALSDEAKALAKKEKISFEEALDRVVAENPDRYMASLQARYQE